MLETLKYFFGSTPTRPVFVIGTGRSGTHWLGHSLGDHPEVKATIEVQPMFGLSTQMALNPDLEKLLFRKLVSAYKRQLFSSIPQLYLDKSHPNIWLAEKLKKSFPQSLFIGIERNPYATVASMMKHKGVVAWHTRWREFPIPNRFLGISAQDAETYSNLSLASQCSMRWLAHHQKMHELRDTLGDSLFVISYESFAHDTQKIVNELQVFLGLKTPISTPDVTLDSLHKWTGQLSTQDIEDISSVVGFTPNTMPVTIR